MRLDLFPIRDNVTHMGTNLTIVPYVGGPIPLGYVLVCSVCRHHSMRSAIRTRPAGSPVIGFECSGRECGIFLTEKEVSERGETMHLMEAA